MILFFPAFLAVYEVEYPLTQYHQKKSEKRFITLEKTVLSVLCSVINRSIYVKMAQ